MISHQIENLTIEGDQLWETSVQDEARRSYMVTPAIEIIEKAGMISGDGNENVYRFRTNFAYDRIWAQLFRKIFSEGTPSDPEQGVVSIRCIPANLTGRYQKLKSGVSETNRAYIVEKARAVELVQKLALERDAAARSKEARNKAAQEGFDDLAL